jgi:hypothetical protein
VEVNFVRRQSVNFSLCVSDALEDSDGFLLYPRGKFAARNEFPNLGEIALVVMRMVMVVVMMAMIVAVTVFVNMDTACAFCNVMFMPMRMLVVMSKVNVKFHPGNGRFLLARNVEVIAVEPEFFQFTFKFLGIHSKVEQRGNEHVAGDAADEVEVKDFHG